MCGRDVAGAGTEVPAGLPQGAGRPPGRGGGRVFVSTAVVRARVTLTSRELAVAVRRPVIAIATYSPVSRPSAAVARRGSWPAREIAGTAEGLVVGDGRGASMNMIGSSLCGQAMTVARGMMASLPAKCRPGLALAGSPPSLPVSLTRGGVNGCHTIEVIQERQEHAVGPRQIAEAHGSWRLARSG